MSISIPQPLGKSFQYHLIQHIVIFSPKLLLKILICARKQQYSTDVYTIQKYQTKGKEKEKKDNVNITRKGLEDCHSEEAHSGRYIRLRVFRFSGTLVEEWQFTIGRRGEDGCGTVDKYIELR